MVFVVITDEGEVLGIAMNEEIAIRKMIEYMIQYKERNHCYTEEEFEEVIADIKLNLQVDEIISAFPAPLWGV